MGSSVVVHLIRHEKTLANYEKRYIGWTDQSIVSKELHLQLPFQVSEVYGSDLRRCEETANQYFPQAKFIPYKSLRELNFGDFEMKTYEELKNNPIYRQWIDHPEKVTPPNGESFEAFLNRVRSCFQQIINKNGEYCFIVHGGVIRALLSIYGNKEKTFQEIYVGHQEIYTLRWNEYSALRRGNRCESLSVVPITEKENM